MRVVRGLLASLLATAIAMQPVAAQNTPYFRLGVPANGGSTTDPGGDPTPPGGGGNSGVLGYPSPFTMRAGSTKTVQPTAYGFDPSVSPVFTQAFPFPSGFSLDSGTAWITASPADPGNYPLTVDATDLNSGSFQARANLTVQAVPALAAISPGPQTGRVGAPFSATFSASNVIGSASWTISQPAGLTASGATLSGTPTSVGAYPVTATVTDSFDTASASVTETFTFTQIPVTVSGTTTLRVGETLSLSATATGLLGTPVWTVDNAPSGMTAAADGTISWTPATAGTYSGIQARVTDIDGAWGVSSPVTVTVQPALGGLALSGYAADYYVAQGKSLSVPAPTVSGGLPPYAVSLSGLPSGMTGSSDGSASGAPSVTGDFTVMADATDGQATPAHASGGFAVHVNAPLAISVAQPSYPGTVGQPVSVVPTVTGGRAPFSFTLVSGAAGNGLSFEAVSGKVSGVPAAAMTQSFTVQVQDANGDTATAAYAVDSVPAPTPPVYPSTASAGVGIAATVAPISAGSGRAPLTYSWAVAPTDGHITLDANTGTVTVGPATQPGPYAFSVKTVDGVGTASSASGAVALTVYGALAASAPAAIVYSYADLPRTVSFSASNAAEPVTWSLTSGSLPIPMSLGSDGVLNVGGTASAVTVTGLAATVTDALGRTASTTFTVDNAAAPAWQGAIVSSATVGQSYSNDVNVLGTGAFGVTGGFRPVKDWTISGTLPPGLSWTSNSSGTGIGNRYVLITGTPTTAGSYTFSFTATDREGRSFGQSPAQTITVAAAPTAASLGAYAATDVAVGAPVSIAAPAISGGAAPFSFALSSGTPPAGVIVNADGSITGSSTAQGAYAFGVKATDANNLATNEAIVSLGIWSTPVVSMSQAPQTVAYVGTPVSPVSVSATGGKAPIGLSATGLPSGLTLSGGTLSGSPTVAGDYTLQFTATESSSLHLSGTSASYPMAVRAELSAPVYPSSVSAGSGASTSVAQTAPGSGGYGALHYAWATAPSDATNITLDATTGTITVAASVSAGSYAFSVKTVDANGAASPASNTVTVSVSGAFTASAPSATFYSYPDITSSQTFTTSNAVGTVTWAITSGTLPSPMSLSNGGVLSIGGTSGAATVSGLVATATDGLGRTATVTFSIAAANAMAWTGSVLANATANVPYTNDVNVQGTGGALGATGGFPSVTNWTLASGSLPTGLSWTTNSSGSGSGNRYVKITGTPSTPGTYTFAFTATDAQGRSFGNSPTQTIVVKSAPVVTLSSLPQTTVGVPGYSQQVTAAGGSGTYVSWTRVSGSLPAGLSFDTNTGVILGTPTAAGSSVLVFAVQDSEGRVSANSAGITLTVNPAVTAPVYAAATGTAAATAGGTKSYTPTTSASGGTGTYTYSLVSPPTGVTMANASTGLVSVGPSAVSGSYTVTVSVTDSIGSPAAQASFTLLVNPAPSAPAYAAVTPVTSGSTGTVNYTTAASGGTGTLSFGLSVSPSPSPGTITANAGGVLSVSSTVPANTYSVTVTPTDQNGVAGTPTTTSVNVASAVSVTTSSLGYAVKGSTYSKTLTASGGTGTYAGWANSSAVSLPSGLSLNASTGVISGTVGSTATTSTGLTFTATDTAGRTSPNSAAMNLTVCSAFSALAFNGPSTAGQSSSYSGSMTATGGCAPYTTTVQSGSLPAGVTAASSSASSTISISGTPSTQGSYSAVLRVQDAAGQARTVTVAITVGAPFGSGLNPASIGFSGFTYYPNNYNTTFGLLDGSPGSATGFYIESLSGYTQWYVQYNYSSTYQFNCAYINTTPASGATTYSVEIWNGGTKTSTTSWGTYPSGAKALNVGSGNTIIMYITNASNATFVDYFKPGYNNGGGCSVGASKTG